jgi:TM2 domain-containing membrane protein YozV
MSYFIIQEDQTKGPYTIGQLRSMWNAGSVTGETLYCEEGFDTWLHLRVLEDQLEDAPPISDFSPVRSKVRSVLTKSRTTYILLALFLGVLGIHNFYAERQRSGVWQLVILIALGWLWIGLAINVVWVLLEICSVNTDGKGFKMI